MTIGSVTAARSLAFGAVADGVWGVAWLPSAESTGPVVLGAAGGAGVVDASVEARGPEDAWRIVGAETDLSLAPASAASSHRADGGLAGLDQLCRAEGRFAFGGSEHRVSCLGWRATVEPPTGRDRSASLRQTAAWFEPGAGMSLLALRPGSARGHDDDLVSAAVIDQDGPIEVSDPRLSTTYGEGGLPRRAGLELWVGDEEEQYPRRAAGEPVGEPAAWTADGLDLRAQLFRWHSSGQDGAGMYLLGTLP